MTSPTRRDVLRVAGLGAAGSVAAAVSVGATATSARAASVPAGSSFVPADLDLHLLRRATYGPTPATLAAVQRKGRVAWVDDQLHPAGIDDSFCDQLLATRFPGLSWSITQARANLAAFSWDLMFDLGVATIARAVWSKRQLLEVMCDFWSNHLNVTNPSDNVWDNRQDYDRRVIRRYALGRYEDMLLASAQHPAMLRYLNNADSSRFTLNENYGRELLELHTVGVDAGYSEEDMYNSALVMTGFGVDWDTGLFAYSANDHYRGHVAVMGFEHTNATGAGGHDVGISYVKYLANHPQTARTIATKLCERFISDTPDPALVDSLAATYLANGTDIKPVLRKLLLSKAFANSVGRKVRRPMEDVVATLRILSYKPDATGKQGMRGLYWMIDDMGHAPCAWHMPNGYPDVAVAWESSGTTLARWNSHLSLAAHWWPDELVQPKLRSLLPKRLPATYGALIDTLSRRLVFRTLASTHKAAVLQFIGKSATAPLGSGDEVLGWRLP
ncbi:MAG: DUF1800 domain-containing protein, partial [Actinomycetes bacterium]